MCAGFINQHAPENGIRRVEMPQIQDPPMQELEELAIQMANLDHLRQRSIREMNKALQKQHDLELDRAEETMALIAMASVHPITVVRALIQFGYEPFPSLLGRKYSIFGVHVDFLPNIFSYMRQLTRIKKFSTIFEGLDSAICIHIIGGTVDEYMWKVF
uniref:ANK_REP_REGION domain-containing protein n=1 Tax=Caenorhabditis tropicalis TaxID=1561998 RepID=A0A1I7T0Y5_9PELO